MKKTTLTSILCSPDDIVTYLKEKGIVTSGTLQHVQISGNKQILTFTFQEEIILPGTELTNQVKHPDANLVLDIKELDLSTRTYNCLFAAKIRTISDLTTDWSEETLFRLRNLGKKGIKEIKESLLKFGYSLRVK